MKELTVELLVKMAESCDIRLVQSTYDAADGVCFGSKNKSLVQKINDWFSQDEVAVSVSEDANRRDEQ